MKKWWVIGMAVLAVITMGSCVKKQVEQKAEDLVVQVIVDGSWILTKYVEGTTDMTSTFSGWECKFYEDRTCDATNGTTKYRGTWDGNAATQSFTVSFKPGTEPLTKLNGTWKITKTSFTFGQFKQTVNGVDYLLEITKK
jgi:hypothetical protein